MDLPNIGTARQNFQHRPLPPTSPKLFKGVFIWSQVEDSSGCMPAPIATALNYGKIYLHRPTLLNDGATIHLHGAAPRYDHPARKALLNGHEHGMQFAIMCANNHELFTNTVLWRVIFSAKDYQSILEGMPDGTITMLGLGGESPIFPEGADTGRATITVHVQKQRDGLHVVRVEGEIPTEWYTKYVEWLNEPY